MNDEEKRHLAGAIRNNLIQAGTFEPVPGHSFAWRNGALYRLTPGSPVGAEVGQPSLLAEEEVYSLDDYALAARALGEALPEVAEAEASEPEPEAEAEAEAPPEPEPEPEPEPAPAPSKSRKAAAPVVEAPVEVESAPEE